MTEVERFFDANAQYEWERLDRHRTELAVTMRAFREFMPPPPAKVLDLGGGPGRYAVALTKQGYAVTLVDLSKGCLDFARQKAAEAGVQIADYVHANATDLSRFESATYDVVLLMGPMYHLLTEAERQTALYEARRVLRPGGTVFAAFITRYTPTRAAAKLDPMTILEEARWLEETLSTGIFRPLVERPAFARFTEAYVAHPSEVRPFMEDGGFESLDLIACEGVVSLIEQRVNELQGEPWQAWVELNYRLGKDPTVHGAAEHLLYVGRKP